MLKKLAVFLKDKQRVFDTANVILGLLMLTALVVFWKTGNEVSMFTVIFSGGLMNIMNGWKYRFESGKKNMGNSMILFGVLVLFIGFVVLFL